MIIINKVFLIGRLTRDPELRYTSSNVPCCTFSLAIDRTFSNQSGEREADFINIVVWKNRAENCGKYLTKGSQIAIDGRIQTRSYDKENGSRRYITEVVAENVQFLNNVQQEDKQQVPHNELGNHVGTRELNPYEKMGK